MSMNHVERFLAVMNFQPATLSTHLGNGCATKLPRHPNVIWEQLAADDLVASFIVDGHHLPPAAVDLKIEKSGKFNLHKFGPMSSNPGSPSIQIPQPQASAMPPFRLAGKSFLPVGL